MLPRDLLKATAASGIAKLPHLNMTEAAICLLGDCRYSESAQRVPIDLSQAPDRHTKPYHDNSVTAYVSGTRC